MKLIFSIMYLAMLLGLGYVVFLAPEKDIFNALMLATLTILFKIDAEKK